MNIATNLTTLQLLGFIALSSVLWSADNRPALDDMIWICTEYYCSGIDDVRISLQCYGNLLLFGNFGHKPDAVDDPARQCMNLYG